MDVPVAIDHTFYATTLLKILDKNGSKRQFNALLLVLNENGFISNFMLTRTESLKELEKVFEELAGSNSIETIYTGLYLIHVFLLKI